MGKYFTIAELTKSNMADRNGIPNRCTKKQAENLTKLIERVLDPLREAYGKPIRVNSGYRCPELNKLVGGSPTSDHMNGRAADIVGTPATKEENRRLFGLIRSMGLEYDQLINEMDYSWVHVSYRDGENRMQVLTVV